MPQRNFVSRYSPSLVWKNSKNAFKEFKASVVGEIDDKLLSRRILWRSSHDLYRSTLSLSSDSNDSLDLCIALVQVSRKPVPLQDHFQ